MPLILKVQTYRHQPVVDGAECRFSESGGSLGRGAANDMVLEDPSKYISRVHAKVSFREGSYFWEDVGVTPSAINDQATAQGERLMLGNGDRIVIGDYQLAVRVEEATMESVAVPMPVPLTIAPAPFNDPALPFFVAPLPVKVADLLPVPGWSKKEAAPLSLFTPTDVLARAKILDVTVKSQGIANSRASLRDDPLGLDLFGGESWAALPTLSQLVPELGLSQSTEYLAPASPGLAALSPPSIQSRHAHPMIPDDYDPMADLIAPGSMAIRSGAAMVSIVNEVEGNTNDAVLQALLRGLGLPHLKFKGSGPALAETVGALLREATAGTMDLLAARKVAKEESNVDMTMMSTRANNPLKFFPDADSALTQLLTNALIGYLPAAEAMAAAFDDLKAHELAVLAGTRAALKAVLHRFDPAEIERGQVGPGVMDKLFGGNRKARMWDQLIAAYADMARDAEDDLQRQFNDQFSAAYEDQVKRLRQ